MVVGDTPRVGAALALAAGVDTSAGSFHCLTNFIVAAVEVVFAAGHLTSISKIVGVSIKSRLTKALADRTNCIGPTLFLGTKVLSVCLVFVWETFDEGVSMELLLASAIIATNCVDTDSVLATSLNVAFVDVITTNEGATFKAFFATARRFAGLLNTFCIVTTNSTFIHCA